MGKLTLLLVGAAIVGGSLLTFNTRQLVAEGEAGTREQQADLLSRQIAESGHAVILANIVGTNGFVAVTDATHRYEGGAYRVEYAPTSTSNRATYRVTGDYGGATHTIESSYEWDPMGYPGPIWLDVPYATASAASGADISGGAVQFDRRKHDALGLQSLAPLGTMESGLSTAVAAASGTYQSGRSASSWPGLLEDLNVEDGEGLYQAALAQTPETTITGPVTLSSNRTGLGAPNEVTHVTGDLTIPANRRFEGEGALVIDGALDVQDQGRFTWTGLVIVRAERQYVPVTLEGTVDLTGGLVIVQHAYPPGGHMDVTTWRDLSTGIHSGNVRGSGSVAPWNDTAFPWLQHKHRFDEDLGTRRVAYLEGGDPVSTQEAWTQFEDTIDRLDDDRIYIEFENENRHGYGVYTVRLDGMSQPAQGMVRDGFGAFSSGGDVYKSQVFEADELEDFVVDIRSLRTLEDRFDGSGCDQWPFCIGEQLDRGGALRVRLREAGSNKVLYESALYWHMQPTEWAIYQAQEDAWRTQIQNGALFGTRLEMGPNASVQFEMGPVLDLVERLGFDGNEVIHLGTETQHLSLSDNLSRTSLGNGWVTVCHRGPTSEVTNNVARTQITLHLSHLDRLGDCVSGASNGAAPYTGPPPPGQAGPPPGGSPAPGGPAPGGPAPGGPAPGGPAPGGPAPGGPPPGP